MKRKRTWKDALPALLAGSLLAPGAAGAAPALPGALGNPTCTHVLQQGGGRSDFVIPENAGVTQPIGAPGNVAACSLTVVPSYGNASAVLEILQWDPATLAPDPTTVALRTRSFDLSAVIFGQTRADFFPPVVTRSLRNVADPPRSTIAIDWRTPSYGGQAVRYEPDGDPAIPAALQFSAGGPRAPLPGAHPVLSHAVCGRSEELQSLQVVQSVMTTNVLSDTSCWELLQRFRVPARSRLHWVEVAFGVPPRPIYYDPVIAILEARAPDPPAVLPAPLAEAPFAYRVTSPFWGSHYDFDHLINLEPGRDYWLFVRVEKQYVLYSRTLTGSETPDFTANIGPSFKRNAAGDDWTLERGRALCFRLIGEPLGDRPLPRGRLRERPLGDIGPVVPPPADRVRPETAPASASGTRSAALALRVAPNPAQGAAFVSWSGASGALRVDVHDAQGRRVGGFAGAAGDGRWLWRGTRDDGHPLPAGVYFVRASDGAGRVASDRVVLIR